MNPLHIKAMKEFRHRSRDELDEDLLYWAERGTTANYNDFVQRLSLEVLLDIRDQNERIIALLSQDHSHEIQMTAASTVLEIMKRSAQ